MDIKICGITNAEDALCAVDAGADYLGFVLYAGSPRGISVRDLGRIRVELAASIPIVAVMVNPTIDAASEAIEVGGANIIQVHGDVAFSAFKDFPHPLWRAMTAGDGQFAPDPTIWPAERYVVDAAVPGQHGGTGVLADWDVAAKLSQNHPVMLAGGLKLGIVAAAIHAVHPLGVDVSSGVEIRPGKKDHAMVRAFIAEARSVAA